MDLSKTDGSAQGSLGFGVLRCVEMGTKRVDARGLLVYIS